MRKIRILPLILAVLLLAACDSGPKIGDAFTGEVNTWEGVSMTAVEGTARPGTVTVEILNTTDAEISSGNEHDFALQTESNGIWYNLERKKDLANTAEARIFDAATPVEMTFT